MEWITSAFPGLAPLPPTGVAALLDDTTVAFVGTLERMSAEFVAPGDLRTRAVYRPQEVLHGALPTTPEGTIDVWVREGTYRESGGVREAFGGVYPLGISSRQQHFVVVDRFTKAGSSFDGQLWLKYPDTLTWFEAGQVWPTPTEATWPQTVVKEGRALGGAGSAAESDVDAFLRALRHWGKPVKQ